MKKRLLVAALLAGILLLVSTAVVRLWPRHYDVMLEGIQYRLGSQEPELAEPVSLHIKGTAGRKWPWAPRSFEGSVDVAGGNIPSLEHVPTVDLVLGQGRGGIIRSWWVENGAWAGYTYGFIFMNDDLSQAAIQVFEESGEGAGSGIKGWSGDNGLTIAAPAKNRAEALAISNEQFKSILLRPLE